MFSLSRSAFHALRISDISHDWNERAPYRAKRMMLQTHGALKLEGFSEQRKRKTYERFLALESLDRSEKAEKGFLKIPCHTVTDDGVRLAYPASAPDKLARLEVRLTTAKEPLFIGMAAIVTKNTDPSDPARELAHLAALEAHGWPFQARASWEQCHGQLSHYFPEWVAGREWGDREDHRRRNVWATANGLFIRMHFCDQVLTDVEIADLEVIRSNRPERFQKEDQAFDLSRLHDMMDFVNDLPEKARVEDSNPPYQGPPPPPALPMMFMGPAKGQVPEWQKQLTPDDMKAYLQLMMNTDSKLLDAMLKKQNDVSSFAEFLALKQVLAVDPAMQAALAEERAQGRKMAREVAGLPAATPTAEKEIIESVHAAIKSNFPNLKSTGFSGFESLRGDLGATEDDLQLVRLSLNQFLDINFRTPHWEGVHTIADLEARVLHLHQCPDTEPREELPPSAGALLVQRTKEAFTTVGDALEVEAQKAGEKFRAQIAALEIPGV